MVTARRIEPKGWINGGGNIGMPVCPDTRGCRTTGERGTMFGNGINFWVFPITSEDNMGNGGVTELPAKIDMLLMIQWLITEEYHFPLIESLPDHGNLITGQRFSQIDAPYFCANMHCRRCNCYASISYEISVNAIFIMDILVDCVFLRTKTTNHHLTAYSIARRTGTGVSTTGNESPRSLCHLCPSPVLPSCNWALPPWLVCLFSGLRSKFSNRWSSIPAAQCC